MKRPVKKRWIQLRGYWGNLKPMLQNREKLLLMALPFVFGVVGFTLVERKPLVDGLFLTLCMYVLGYTDAPANVWIELARWTAPLATASGVLLALAGVRTYLRNARIYLSGNSVAVYGPEQDCRDVLAYLPNGIEGKDQWIRAHKYILLHDEKTNFDFYHRHREKIGDAQVCIKCDAISPQLFTAEKLQFFSPEEIAARLFWRKESWYRLSCKHDHKMKIVFLGFGNLGEQVLLSGLQSNIFAADQQIEYHIFGDAKVFLGMHNQLDQIDDEVIFHKEQWYEALALLEEAQLVLVLEQQEQMALLNKLVFTLNRDRICVFGDGSPQLQHMGMEQGMEARVQLDVYDWKSEALKPEYIFTDDLFSMAKRINLRYSHIYMGVPETSEEAENQWNKLNCFTRYSNIYAADYHELRLRMLARWGYGDDPQLSPEHMEILAELEHIRWCRYHYLNNWRQGVPANGKNKDAATRIHTCLIPYGALSETEKEKDRENIRVLLSIKR